MINGKSVLAIIPARGGSKRLPGKNILEVGGKPLIAWTIEEARKSKYIDRLILSSEDQKIISVARAWGCEVPFVRPAELAQDETPGIETVLHAIDALLEKYDYIVLLQPTSPLRKSEDIDGTINLCIKKNAPACVTVTELDKSPYWMFFLDKEGGMTPIIRMNNAIKKQRQDLPKGYVLNGACYIASTDWLIINRTFITEKTVAYKMNKERSLDIDDEVDLKIFLGYTS